MPDDTYYNFQARRLQETQRMEEPIPKTLIKKIQETDPKIIARMLWENRKNLTEGTRRFVQADDIINRSTKPDDTLKTKKSSKYPGIPMESNSTKSPFEHRTEGAVNPEPTLHETFPFTKEGYSIGPSGAITTAEENPFQEPMDMPPMVEPQPDTGLGSSLGPVGSQGLENMWAKDEPHTCPVCNEPHIDQPGLDNHMQKEHSFPFAQEGEIPSPNFPYGS